MNDMRNFRTRHALIAAIGVVMAAPLFVLAQEYVPLAAIPGVTNQGSLGEFLSAAFRMGVIIAGFLAVVLIAYNGLVYMTSGAAGSKEDAKGWMWEIFLGLGLILFSIVILKVINPDILNFRLDVKPLAPTEKTVRQDTVYGRDAENALIEKDRNAQGVETVWMRTTPANMSANDRRKLLEVMRGECEIKGYTFIPDRRPLTGGQLSNDCVRTK